MKYTFEHIEKTTNNLHKLNELCVTSGIDYPLVMQSEFIVAKNGSDKYYGAIGFNLKKKYPQFQHIILNKKVSPTVGMKLIDKMEKFLIDKGYTNYVTFVTNKRNDIQIMAQRIGLQPYESDERGVWFYKSLIKKSRGGDRV